MLELPFSRLPHGEGLPVPALATPGSAGYDVASADEGVLAPRERRLFRTGLMIALVNLGTESFQVTRGMRVAQLVFARVEQVGWRELAELPPTGRGEGGFGSTGR